MDEYHRLVRETFVVRLWREATNPTWRGQIVHLPDQESIHFTTLAGVADFIHRFVPEIQADQPHPGKRAGLGLDTPAAESSGGDEG